jgi:hypothetical protein
LRGLAERCRVRHHAQERHEPAGYSLREAHDSAPTSAEALALSDCGPQTGETGYRILPNLVVDR